MRPQIDKEGVKLHEIKPIQLLFASVFAKLPYLPNQMGHSNASYAGGTSSAVFLALGTSRKYTLTGFVQFVHASFLFFN